MTEHKQPLINLTVRYTFHENADSTFKIEADCKPRYYEEVIINFLQDMVGSGVTENEPDMIERDTYTITLRLDMEDDTYRMTHDCGAPSLVVGILLDVLKRVTA